MMYESNATLHDIAERCRQAMRVLLLTHQKPDGDAIGSCLALARWFEGRDVPATILLSGAVPEFVRAIANPTTLHHCEDESPDEDADLVIVLDTGAWSQVRPLDDWLRGRRDRIIGIDHHAHGDGIAAVRYIDPGAASTTQLLVELFDVLGAPLTPGREGLAEPLFVGLATDTGWFRHPNADARAFAVASRLLAAGVDKSRLYQVIEECAALTRLHLMGRALGSMDVVADGVVSIMTLGPDDFTETGGSPEDLTGVVNEPLCVGALRASILITRIDGETKISLRSKPSTNGERFIDVNVVARQLGGGGHVHAAGARLSDDIPVVRERILRALDQQPDAATST